MPDDSDAPPSDETEPPLRPGYRLVFILDPDGLVRQVAEASGIGDWPQSGYVGRTLGEISAERAGPERGDLWDVRVAMAREAHAPALYSDRVPGAPVDDPPTVSSTVIPVRTARGELQAIVVELEDRTVVGPREAQLQESERRFRELAESLPQMVWESDGAGNARYFSRRWEAFTGRPVRELLGRGYIESFHPDDLDRLAAQRDATDGHGLLSFRLLRHDGEYRWMEAHLALVRAEDGTPLQAIGTAADVTDRRRDEEDRLRAQKREMVGTLLGGIGHDFNNVLSAIVSNAALARHELAIGQPADTSIAEIERGAARAADLVRRVLMQGREETEPRQPVDLGAVTREACDLLRSALPPTVDLRVAVEPSLPKVSADPTQIHQLVVNLVTNARQALHPAPGTIDVSVTAPAPSGDGTTERVLIRVRDDGPGMPDDVRQRVFDPYFTTKPAGDGTGLGLAAVQTIVRGHDGAVDVESAPGAGATFTVSLPADAPMTAPSNGTPTPADEDAPLRAPAAAPGSTPTPTPTPAGDAPDSAASAASAAPIARGSGLRLLFVDDEPALVQLAERALPASGLAPVGFTDPRDALSAFTAAPESWAALVTDLSMPELDGLTLIEHMRSARPDLPVVLTSGYLRPADVERAETLRVDAIVPKPCSMTDLAAAVQAAAAGQS